MINGSLALKDKTVMATQESSLKMSKCLKSVSGRIRGTLQEIREFLGVDRVNLYRFLDDGSGKVIAEALSPQPTLCSLLNLQFPASDIPEVARQRFLEQQVRILVDVGLGRQLQQFPHQPNPTYINSSPCHLKYLEQLGVKASFTSPIVIRGELWGLLLIHHHQRCLWEKSQLSMLELLSERLTLLITTEQLSQCQKALLHREQTLKTLRNMVKSGTDDLPLQDILEQVVHGLDGCGGTIELQHLSGETEIYEIGEQPLLERQGNASSETLEETPAWQRYLQSSEEVYLQELNCALSLYESTEGNVTRYVGLVIPLFSQGHRKGYLTVFRHNQLQTIWWAGRPPQNPEDMKELRSSFLAWKEQVQLCARQQWTTEEITLGCAIAQLLADTFEQQQLTTILNFQDNYHALTQLPNRTLFKEQLNLLTQETTRAKELAAVIFLDLDRFQQVNNTLGHQAGDQLLQQVARRLQAHLTEQEQNCLLAHWQGDKFVMLLQQLSHLDSAELDAKLRLIEDCFHAPFDLFGHEVYVKASWGVAISPYDGTDAETLLLNAETAMYSAKRQGRNRYQVYTPSLRSPLNPLTLEAEIRSSLQNQDFCLYYQPQMNLHTGNITAVEALMRWQHPQRGLLAPKHFIPFAEESDLICELGDWSVKTACEQLAQWREQGIKHLRVAVNISGRQFQQVEFVDKIRCILNETGIPASTLELEITETTAAQNIDLTNWTLKQLQEMGVSVALDDFGMGYSSLNAIKNFPLNTLKIDRHFIRDIETSAVDSAIVNSVITLAHGLNLQVVTEGVESLQQLESLTKMPLFSHSPKGVQAVQGYLISEPLAAAAITPFLLKSRWENPIFPEPTRSAGEQTKEPLAFASEPENQSQFSLVGHSPLQQLFNQTRREQLLAQMTQQVHASLDLDEIFQVTVEEIRDFLQTDRVVLYRFDEDWKGQVVIESVGENWEPLFNREIDDPCFQIKSAPLYANGRVLAIQNIETAEMTSCYREMLRSFQVRANLVIPILNQDHLWGLLIAHHCRSPRHWHSTEVSLLQQLATQVGVAIHQAELYQQLQQANQKLEELAIQDSLTQIANRRWFDHSLDRQWQRLQREQKPLTLILCDIDHFKLYNDYYGHQAGDACLIQVAQVLQTVAKRPDDLVARYGGEEFAIILPDTPCEKAMVVAQRARQAVASLRIPHEVSSTASYVTISLGVGAVIPGTGTSRKELIRRADQALYAAKGWGRDRAINFLHQK